MHKNHCEQSCLARSLCALIVAMIVLGCATGNATSQDMSPTEQPTSAPAPSSAPASSAPEGQSGTWMLLFADEFDGAALDSSRWVTCYWWDTGGCTNKGNQELEWYQPENVIVGDGMLTLRALDKPIAAPDGETYPYTSGMVTSGRVVADTATPARFVFQYGYVEMRARVPRGKGLWPAFWLLPANHSSKPEIDVMEILGSDPSTVHMTIHYLDENGGRDNSGESWTGPDFSEGWHTFAVDWRPDAVIWYVDGVERYRYTDAQHISHTPMYLLANLAVGGDWPGSPDAGTPFPSDFVVDYIRVWRQALELALAPTADTYVDSSAPASNMGAGSVLYSDNNPVKVSYLTFDLSSATGLAITGARLRVSTTSDPSAGAGSTHYVQLAGDLAWDEKSLTYANRPNMTLTELGALTNAASNSTYDIPLNLSLLQPYAGGQVTLVIDTPSEDGLYLYSRESDNHPPRLILTIDCCRGLLPVVLSP